MNRNKKDIFIRELFNWYNDNKRFFYWRKIKNPYKIMITEILLQRTRAETVNNIIIDFFNKYPNLDAFNNAKYEDFEAILKPLGLKKRIHYLYEIAKYFRNHNIKKIPNNVDELLKLKGIGNYTANAIMCFSYGKKYPIVDWNVARIINRIWGIDLSSSPHTNKDIINFAKKLLPKKKFNEYNWALLDFAALVCKPQKPDCCNCPMQNFCTYHQNRFATQNKTR